MTAHQFDLFICDCSEWADPYDLEAIVAEVFDALETEARLFEDQEQDLCSPYGAGFGVVDMVTA
jgi:hypothetical protein